jgi:prolyl-tRNA editing enzyme YbaK/EbsC (Cys-tRNA(Pro) deacylase)
MEPQGLIHKQTGPAAAPAAHKDGFRACAPLGEKRTGVMQIYPQSQEWSGMKIEKRLEHTPYVIDLIKSGKARLMFYDKATSTCQEKADIAGIDVTSVFKAFVVDHFDPDEFVSKLHLVVTDGTKRVNIQKLFGAMQEFEHMDARRIQLYMKPSKTPPTGMPFGTIGPLIGPRNIDEIGFIIMKEANGERDMEVDLSIGDVSLKELGEHETMAHQFSVRIKYGDLVEVLSRHYPDKVRIVGSIPAN